MFTCHLHKKQTNKTYSHTQKKEQNPLYHISVNATLTLPATHWFNSFGFAGNNPDWWQIRLQHWGKLEQSRSNHSTPGKKTRQINGTEVDLSLAESPKLHQHLEFKKHVYLFFNTELLSQSLWRYLTLFTSKVVAKEPVWGWDDVEEQVVERHVALQRDEIPELEGQEKNIPRKTITSRYK